MRKEKPIAKEKEKIKDRKSVPLSDTLVCPCGKSYKYGKAFEKHRLNCSGVSEAREDSDE